MRVSLTREVYHQEASTIFDKDTLMKKSRRGVPRVQLEPLDDLIKRMDERHPPTAAAVRPSRIPSLCTRSTRAGIEWCCFYRAFCMARPR